MSAEQLGMAWNSIEKTPLRLLLRNVPCFKVSVAQHFLHGVNMPQYHGMFLFFK
jgi:hypothetical protein